MSTFVTVGNALQPFGRLLDAVAAIAAALPQPVLVQHGHTPFGSKGLDAVAFMAMSKFEAAMAQSRLVITHAGAGSLIHAVRVGKKPVVMPRQHEFGEHIDSHQIELAEAFASINRIVLVKDSGMLGAAVQEALRAPTVVMAGAAAPMTRMLEERLTAYERQFCFVRKSN
jgi:beta-1,4-N-acetylglucosaminyltransferase